MKRRTAPLPLSWFRFDPARYVTDARLSSFNAEESGAWINLVAVAWLQAEPDCLPNDDTVLARIARVSDERWRVIKDRVLANWEQSETHVRSTFFALERTRAEHVYKAQKQSAAKTNESRYLVRSPSGHRAMTEGETDEETDGRTKRRDEREKETNVRDGRTARAEHPSVAAAPPSWRAATDADRKNFSLVRSTDSTDRPTGLERIDVSQLERQLAIVSAIQRAMEPQYIPIDNPLSQRLSSAAGTLSLDEIKAAIAEAIRKASGPIKSATYFEPCLREAAQRAGAA